MEETKNRNTPVDGQPGYGKSEWHFVLDTIRKTDPAMFMNILRKLLHLLCKIENQEAQALLDDSSISTQAGEETGLFEENKPSRKRLINKYDEYINAILSLAYDNFEDDEILKNIQKWIQEDKSIPLIRTLEARESSLADIHDALRKYFHMAPEKFELSKSMINGLRVALLRRFFTEDLRYIETAKPFVRLTDFYQLIHNLIYTPTSQGKLGGKSSGIFLASNILEKLERTSDLLKHIKIPKTWFVASDCILSFIRYNNLEEVFKQKYKDVDELRLEYPLIIQLFKNAVFPPEIRMGISAALDDFGDAPVIIRSSSLLEDQLGASFSGKYKSLFLANQGTKEERLSAIEDAIAEVYASTFAPDPIEYRFEKGLLDFQEEMGVMIQQVVGKKIGKYYFPTFAGVAFSQNEFRWSTRIKREDGLIRIVPGLGTRAVDRVGDDYPVLVSPGQPNLRVNISIEEIVKYSPKKMDVINLESNQFETIEVQDFIKNFGDECTGLDKIASVIDEKRVRPIQLTDDFQEVESVITFDGLFSDSDFMKKTDKILKVLQKSLATPVDIEFASDGDDFYLLQCRPQSSSSVLASDDIPKNIPPDIVLFNAHRYVSNGRVPDIEYIVYVDGIKYGELPTKEQMFTVGRIIGKLNKLLPKRKFILMGPGRWGSRGDIKLGVNVTYSDINNTSMLIEIARQKGSYVPDLSFGTHFFQDLVEASIRYLPLFPDGEENIFNDDFFSNSKNSLKELLPDFDHYSDVVKVVNVPEVTNGNILKVLVNGDEDEAVALFMDGEGNIDFEAGAVLKEDTIDRPKLRLTIANRIAQRLNAGQFGVTALYVIVSEEEVSVEEGVELIVHLGKETKKNELEIWFDAWNSALVDVKDVLFGEKSASAIKVQYITDEDFESKTGLAGKILTSSESIKMLSLH